MILIDYFKVFVFCTLCLVVCTQARSVSYSQFGDIRIELHDDKLICDKIECPKDTYSCYVSKTNQEDPAVLVRKNICYAQDNTPLAEKIFSTSVDPKNKIRVELTKLNIDNQDFNDEEFQKNLQKELQGVQDNLNNEMKNLHSNLEDMNKEMKKNLQNQMSALDENLKNMKHNLAHMFD